MSLAVLHAPPIPCLSKAQQNVEGKIELAGLEKRSSASIVRIPRNSHLQINLKDIGDSINVRRQRP
jgi:hypothetical protein